MYEDILDLHVAHVSGKAQKNILWAPVVVELHCGRIFIYSCTGLLISFQVSFKVEYMNTNI